MAPNYSVYPVRKPACRAIRRARLPVLCFPVLCFPVLCLPVLWTVGFGAAAAANAQEAGPRGAAYTFRCYQAGVLIVAEQVRVPPRKDQGMWKGERWSADPGENGLAIVFDPGESAACLATENPKRK